MENSRKLFLETKDSPQWFVALGNQSEGPMTAEDICEKIASHQITSAHYVWKKGQAAWKRICDVTAFQALVPNAPEPNQPQIRKAQSTKRSPPWFLYYKDAQYGPFSQEEVQRFLNIGKIHGGVHAWNETLKTWEQISKLPQFKASLSNPKTKPTDNRASPRRPLVAKIIMSDEQSVIVGVCRDISIGGLQVLTQFPSAKVGGKLKMNISPSTHEGATRIEPFVVQGVIVRILEDGRGFSFRFEKLAERARQAIESYVESPR